MNKTILLGRLSKEPDIKFYQTNNIKVAMFSLAVNRKYVKQGEERIVILLNINAMTHQLQARHLEIIQSVIRNNNDDNNN